MTMYEETDWLEGGSFSMPRREEVEKPAEPEAPSRSAKKKRGKRVDEGASYDRMRRALVFVSSISIVLAVGALMFSSYRVMEAEELSNSLIASQQMAVVATRDIAPGEVISESDLAESAVSVTYVPVDAVSLDDRESLVGKRALTRLSAGLPVATSAVKGSSAPSSLASSIEDGHVAVSISLDSASGMSPLLNVGDRVDVVSVTEISTSVIVSDVRVLALDGEFAAMATQGYTNVTLELTDSEALLVSASAPTLRLALLPVEIVEEA